jgi:hypothetical protein
MHSRVLVSTTTLIALVLSAAAAAGVKNVSYPEIKVKVAEAYKPDAAFEKMREALVEATAKKDAAALFALVGPMFVWTLNGGPIEYFDMGRDASHNFKVVFGFRAFGKDTDGDVLEGPFWDALAAFAADSNYYQVEDAANLVCGPIAAKLVDDQVFERARKNIETGNEGANWYFTVADVAVIKAPGDTGAPIAKIGKVALPVLSVYPLASASQPPPPATHLEVLLPSGKIGWIPAAAVRPLESDRLCYAKTPNGDWKIVSFDQSE